METLWRFAERAGITYFGTSAAFVLASMKAGVEPARETSLAALHSIGSTGSPLPPRASPGCTSTWQPTCWSARPAAAPTSAPRSSPHLLLLPIHPGEIQCRSLGAKVESFDEHGRPVVGEVGELVVTEPLPSMPLFLWNDPDGERYRDSYFSTWPGCGATATGSRSPSVAPASSARSDSTGAASAWARPSSTGS